MPSVCWANCAKTASEKLFSTAYSVDELSVSGHTIKHAHNQLHGCRSVELCLDKTLVLLVMCEMHIWALQFA